MDIEFVVWDSEDKDTVLCEGCNVRLKPMKQETSNTPQSKFTGNSCPKCGTFVRIAVSSL